MTYTDTHIQGESVGPEGASGGRALGQRISSAYGRIAHRLLTALIVAGLASTAVLISGGADDAAAASGTTWAVPVQITPLANSWFTLDLEIGINGIYVLSCVYGDGNGQLAQIFRSTNGGSTWSSASPVFGGEPGMCLYNDAGKDCLIMAAGMNLAKSTNNGACWKNLAPMPDQGWRFMAVGTNASWTGSAVDNDIYVMGSLYGGQEIGFAKSTDGGLSWTAPMQLTYNSYTYNTMPRITSDGSRLYIVYEIASNNKGIASIVTRTSNDWGATWSDEKVLISNRGTSYCLRPYALHSLNNARALMTYVDIPSNMDVATTTGNYGYYDFATLTYVPIGSVSGPDWMIGEGFSGCLVSDVFYVAWIKVLDQIAGTPTTAIMFSTSMDSGLTSGYSAADAMLVKSSPQATWKIAPQTSATWCAKMLNHGGMKSFTLVVTDTTVPRRPVIVSMQKIVFSDLGAYPNGWAFSGSVSLVGGHTYEVTAKQPNGWTSSYVLFYNQLA